MDILLVGRPRPWNGGRVLAPRGSAAQSSSTADAGIVVASYPTIRSVSLMSPCVYEIPSSFTWPGRRHALTAGGKPQNPDPN